MKIQFPKNIQQIGESPSGKRVYLEDYVVTFLEQVQKRDSGTGRSVLLYGRREQDEEMTCYFVYGAVIWEQNVEPEKQEAVFPAYQIIGEAYICRNGEEPRRRLPDYGPEERDRLLYLVGEDGDHLAVFLSGEAPCVLGGYYIFYEKNEMMQNILLEWYKNNSGKKDTPEQDYAVREFRERYLERQEEKQRRRMMTVLYAASLFLVMLCCITGITMINQYDKMLQMQAGMEHLILAMNERELPETQPVMSGMVESRGTEREEAGPQTEETGISPSGMDSAAAENGKDAFALTETEENGKKSVAQEEEEHSAEEAGQTPDTKQEQAAEETVYIVKQGDTLAAISKTYYGTIRKVQDICEKNQIEEPDNIYVGQKILLP